MSSVEEDDIESNSDESNIFELPPPIPLDPNEPFITTSANEIDNISYLRALADFYDIDRSFETTDGTCTNMSTSSTLTKAFPSLEETTAKINAEKKKSRKQKPSPVKISFDQFTAISAKEQTIYLELYQKYHNKVVKHTTEEEMAEIKTLGELHRKVSFEQEQFIKYMKDSYASRKKVYEYLSFEMERYVKDLSLSQLKLALAYPCWYKFEEIIQFWTPEKIMKESLAELKFVEVLVSLGKVPRIVYPMPNHKCILPKEYGKLNKRFNALKEQNADTHPSRKVCSQDTIALSLAEQHDADVILSTSSFATLMLQPPYENNWELVFTVKEVGAKKILILDKPLCPGSRKARKQSQRYYKYASRVQYTHFNPSRRNQSVGGELQSPEGISRKIVSTNTELFEGENVDSILDLEVFGLSIKSPIKQMKIETKAREKSPRKDSATLRDEKDCAETIKDIVDEIEKGFLAELNLRPVNSDPVKEIMKVETEPSISSPIQTFLGPSSASESEMLVIDLDSVPMKRKFPKAKGTKNRVISDSDLSFSSEEDFKNQLPANFQLIEPSSPRTITTRSQTRLNRSSENDSSKDLTNKNITGDDKENHGSSSDHSTEISPQSPTPSSYGDAVVQTPRIIPLGDDQSDDEKVTHHAKSYPTMKDTDNIRYSLFSLSRLKILFRNKIDGLKPPQATPYVIYPKLEYFCDYCAEECTPSQVFEQWVMLATHPNSTLLRVRVNALTAEVVMQEEFTLETFMSSADMSKLRIKPSQALTQLNSLLETFLNLSPGQYYLSHKENESMASLYKESNKKSYNLHALISARLNNVDEGDLICKDSNWVNFDPSVLLPSHLKNNQVPGLFSLKNKQSMSPPKSQGKKKRFGKARKAKTLT